MNSCLLTSQPGIIDVNTGGPDVEYDYNNILAVYKTMYENASKIL